MFSFIKNFVEKQKRIRRFKTHKRGYAWAAVKLLKGDSPNNVISYVNSAKDFNAYTEFDRGIEDAVRDFKAALSKNVLNTQSAFKIKNEDVLKRY